MMKKMSRSDEVVPARETHKSAELPNCIYFFVACVGDPVEAADYLNKSEAKFLFQFNHFCMIRRSVFFPHNHVGLERVRILLSILFGWLLAGECRQESSDHCLSISRLIQRKVAILILLYSCLQVPICPWLDLYVKLFLHSLKEGTQKSLVRTGNENVVHIM